jgi:hypothetical protein
MTEAAWNTVVAEMLIERIRLEKLLENRWLKEPVQQRIANVDIAVEAIRRVKEAMPTEGS